ncbi:MAG: tryptophan 2,3-dioxygenase [Rhodothermales bacterium]|nr:tryptophan 2,3-dioxygenase [Rhodothermales bacterium]
MPDSDQLYYGDYLDLDRLLGAQRLESTARGRTAHDEMLFIIVHQAYELWFKQILWELEAVIGVLESEIVEERELAEAVAKLERIVVIQRLLLQQIDVIETMTPLDFMEFRDLLVPASGFQSAQFRLIENRLGMRPGDRLRYSDAPYTSRLSDEDRDRVRSSEKRPSMFDVIERWLERTPFVHTEMFDFWDEYGEAVDRMLEGDRRLILENSTLNKEEKERQIEGLERTRAHFNTLLDAESYERDRREGKVRLSHDALQAALLIHLYRNEPILHQPFRLLETLVDIDENFTTWRYRHALMVMRMIGTKIGTGGSSGHHYLRRSAEHNRVFKELMNLSTFLIPRSEIPDIPKPVVRQLGFHWRPDDTGEG